MTDDSTPTPEKPSIDAPVAEPPPTAWCANCEEMMSVKARGHHLLCAKCGQFINKRPRDDKRAARRDQYLTDLRQHYPHATTVTLAKDLEDLASIYERRDSLKVGSIEHQRALDASRLLVDRLDATRPDYTGLDVAKMTMKQVDDELLDACQQRLHEIDSMSDAERERLDVDDAERERLIANVDRIKRGKPIVLPPYRPPNPIAEQRPGFTFPSFRGHAATAVPSMQDVLDKADRDAAEREQRQLDEEWQRIQSEGNESEDE